MGKREEFLIKFAALLKEYNATILFSVGEGSDTHGLYDEHMKVWHQPDPTKFAEEEWLRVDGWTMNHHDIEGGAT